MGCGTESNDGWQTQTGTSQTTFDPASEQEKQLLAGYSELGDEGKKTLMGLMAQANGSGSMFALTPEDQAQLDSAYASGRLQLETGMRDYADFTAGGRGMRMSDTPVSQQALQRYGLGLAEFESQKANAGFNLGFQANQARNALGLSAASTLPAGYGAAFAPLFNERMASGKTTTTGVSNMNSSKDASIMQQILTGTQAYNQLGQGTQAFMGAWKMSDKRLKRDITPVSWNWKTGGNEQLGVIAQDVQKSHPHLVSTDADGVLSVDYGAMTAMLLSEREWLYAELASVQDLGTRSPITGE